jgi:hypothetical protein
MLTCQTEFSTQIFTFTTSPRCTSAFRKKAIDWQIYFGDIPQSLLLTHQQLFPTHYKHYDQFFKDAAGPEAAFPAYSFLEPYYFGAKQNDQHPPTDVLHGEALIANIYNAIRANEPLWESTLFVLLYDEHGGFYDHVVPPPTVAPDAHTDQFKFDQLGVRVPTILISPWLDSGVLSTHFDHTSLLKYATDKWSLGPLGNRTAQANSFADVLKVRKSARQDCPASVPIPIPVPNPTDAPLSAHQAALVGFSQHLEVNETQPSNDVIAMHAKAMASSYQDQSAAVAQRVDQFLAK